MVLGGQDVHAEVTLALGDGELLQVRCVGSRYDFLVLQIIQSLDVGGFFGQDTVGGKNMIGAKEATF